MGAFGSHARIAIVAFMQVLEDKRRNDLFAYDGDAKDEQLAGFGELFQELNWKLDSLVEVLGKIIDER